ncbi:prepilin peptidase dependent protein D [Cricetibacter osteomyelitidis]|uniref:Prepilin peptidase dependent protein D n=1 Tax=Cricetibacter osteomyelitidis TaxID=1521931 RepID=A0A4R2SYW2_9PAST|nr:prepilin peptidase-dependent pilin [Cricetibacter osteomyelitidis]TCP95739.1 prepilin peptidase dependent protein D [Cricetibacter osteomyelitidis]
MKLNQSYALKKGFTLIELMIVIAIVAILATIAIPSYQNYTKKAAISELLQAAAPYRSEVELCIYNTNSKDNCTAGKNGIQADISLSKKKYLKSVSVAAGVITVNGQGTLDNESYTLTAEGDAKSGVSWKATCNGTKELYPAGFCSN